MSDALYGRIFGLSLAAVFASSTWFVISKEAAVQIHNSLKRHLLSGDKLAVVQCRNWGAWSGFNDEASEWLKGALKDEV